MDRNINWSERTFKIFGGASMISSLLILSAVGLPNAIAGIVAWELSKKVNYKIHGNKSMFVPKDAIQSYKKWSDLK